MPRRSRVVGVCHESPNLDRLDGLYVGLLDSDELAVFEQAIKDGKACRSYEGPGGMLGLSKVKLLQTRGG